MTDADLAVAFERGVLHDRYRGVRPVGSGVGLALVAGLIERMDGRCQAGHAPEGGARFTVWLPARGASLVQPPPTGPPDSLGLGGRPTDRPTRRPLAALVA